MQENNEKNGKSIIAIICMLIIFILVVIIIGDWAYYMGTQNAKNGEEQKSNVVVAKDNIQNKTSVNEVSNDNIGIEDKVSLTYMATDESINLFYGYIKDGKLYYKFDNETANANNTTESAFKYNSEYLGGNREDMQVLDDIGNIKRIKEFNFGSSVDPAILLITEDGKVYIFKIVAVDNIKPELCKGLANYKIDDILDVLFDSSDFQYNIKVKMQDGTTSTVKIDMMDML